MNVYLQEIESGNLKPVGLKQYTFEPEKVISDEEWTQIIDIISPKIKNGLYFINGDFKFHSGSKRAQTKSRMIINNEITQGDSITPNKKDDVLTARFSGNFNVKNGYLSISIDAFQESEGGASLSIKSARIDYEFKTSMFTTEFAES